jgi:5'-nucleotidase
MMGIHAFVVLLHQGGSQTPYGGWTDTLKPAVSPDIAQLVSRFDDDCDVVCCGHTHSFTNAVVKRKNGHTTLVTQAFSKGSAFAEIVCTVDKETRDIVAKKARIVTVWGDEGPGLKPDRVIAALVDTCIKKVAPQTERVLGSAGSAISSEQNNAGESALGNLIADAQRSAMRTDFALMNPGGIRADLIAAGPITWGELFAVQPFGNTLVKMSLSGRQIYAALNQQWEGQPYVKMLETSGLSYTWDNDLPVGNRVVQVRKGGVPIDTGAVYSITVNNFLAGGGDHFTVFQKGRRVANGPADLDALVAYVKSQAQPIKRSAEGRTVRLH